MANMHLVTGYAGQEHVTSADHGAFYGALFGSGNYVLDRGEKFALTKLSDNAVRVASGDALLQGRHCRIADGLYVDLTVETGTQGYLRNDLVCIRYTKDENTGVEESNLVILRGDPVAASPADPAYTDGDVFSGAFTADFPLYRLRLNGITLESIDILFDASFPNFDAFLAAFAAFKAENAEDFAAVAAEFAAVRTEMTSFGYAKVKTGTYMGTGTYGASNPTKVTVDFTPKAIWILKSQGTSDGVHFPAASTGVTPKMYTSDVTLVINSGGYIKTYFTWGDNSVSWYSDGYVDDQDNQSDRKFFYIVIGV